MDQPLLVDRLKNVQVLQCGNVFCSRLGEKQPRGGFILFYFFSSVPEGTCKKGNQTRFLFRNREAWGSEARGGGGCSQSGQ